MKPADIVAILRRRDLAALKQVPTNLLDQTAVAGEAARLAWLEGLDYLAPHITDWNRIGRGYRPLHAAIQEKTHGAAHDDPDRLRAIEWLLAHGADPEALAAWPPARALLVACFTGVHSYVETIRAVARQDAFTAIALGQTARIKTLLQRDPAFPNTRGDGGLTPLMIACATRFNPQASLAIATLLLDHDVALDTTTRSWDHDVDAIYFATHHTALFQLLLNRGANPTQALVPALWQDHLDLAALCLSAGAKINEARDGDKPILNQMIRWGRVKQALWLLDQGADPTLTDSRGWTARDQAESRGNKRLIEAVKARL